VSEADYSIHISNYSGTKYHFINFDLFYYNRATQKVETFSDIFSGIEASKKMDFTYVSPEIHFEYADAWKYVFLGIVLQSTTDENGAVVNNPIYKDEANYVKTKYLEYALMLEKVRKTNLASELRANNHV
ncbi:hypothetical protein, partial [Exiguobacterium sp. SH0S2]